MGIVIIMQPSAKFNFRAEFRRFMDAASGQVAITFGLVLIPLILAIGCGVDISRAVVVKMRLGEALDAAGLAVSSTGKVEYTALVSYCRRGSVYVAGGGMRSIELSLRVGCVRRTRRNTPHPHLVQ